jgi:hypothetical protein
LDELELLDIDERFALGKGSSNYAISSRSVCWHIRAKAWLLPIAILHKKKRIAIFLLVRSGR